MNQHTKQSLYGWAVGIILAAFFAAICYLVCIPKAHAAGPKVESGSTTFVLLAKKSLRNDLPSCYGPDCRGKLQDVKVYLVNPVLAYGEAWLWAGGKLYHAHVWRINVHKDYFLWAFQGHPLWYKAIKYVADATDPANVKGPAEWPKIDLLPQAQCQLVAQGAMINVTSDAGTLIQPSPARHCNPAPAPSDAGPVPDLCWTEIRKWPDGSVVTCSGTGYWLARNRHGGQPGQPPNDADLPTPVDAGAPPPGSGGSWETPDAQTTHVCPSVLIGTPCP